MAKAKHTIRIISGTHRSRKLPVLDFEGLRPTGDRVREMLFNWLQMNIAGKKVLDLCAGSGALGFEAASRGAKDVTMVESNHVVAKQLISIERNFNFKNVSIVNNTAQQFISGNEQLFDVVFIDPPFAEKLWEELTELVVQRVNAGGFVYREVAITAELQQLDKNWQLYRQKVFGQVKIELWKKL